MIYILIEQTTQDVLQRQLTLIIIHETEKTTDWTQLFFLFLSCI